MSKLLFTATTILFPAIALAAPQNFKEVVSLLTEIIKDLTLVAASLSVLAFFWGIVLFIARSGESNNTEKAKNIMGWGLFALFILVSFWGIIRIIEVTFVG